MTPYLFLLFICIVSSLVSLKDGKAVKISNILFWISVIIATGLVAFRDKEMGTDTIGYWYFFKSDSNGYSTYDIDNIEIGYRLFQSFMRTITSNPDYFIMTLGIISFLPLCLVINKLSTWKNLSLFMLVTIGTTTICYILFYSMLRQCFAFGVLTITLYLYSQGYIKRDLKLLFLCLIAISIHKTAMFFLPVFFFDMFVLQKKWIYVALVVSYLLGISFQQYAPLMRLVSEIFFDGKFNYYVYVLQDGIYQYGVTIPLNGLCALMFFYGSKNFLNNIYVKVFTFGVIINNIFSMAGNSDRLTMYYMIYGALVIPSFLRSGKMPKLIKYFTVFVILFYFSNKYLKVLDNAEQSDVVRLVPYKSFLDLWM